ncbi:hypothetical protein AB0L70_22085 [Kribbella sp. NPDC051952]|uniref:hypothetical protein n=1 Tax=Kribbella sp. NPDC051952 TaxID=3154851 RepID=UPI0034310CC2
MPAERLPHLTALAERINGVLKARGIDQRFGAGNLQQLLSAEFGKIVTDEGLVLRVGRKTTADLRIRLSVDELVEVLNPQVKASETISGLFTQTARKLAATSTGRFTTAFTLPMSALLKLLGHATGQSWIGDLTLKGDLSAGRTRALTANAAEYAQLGAVEDNRGESTLFTGKASWYLDLRTDRTTGWTATETIAEGNKRDIDELRAWASHAYTVPPAHQLEHRPDLATGRLPAHLLSSISGVEQLTDDVIAANNDQLHRLGATRQQVEDQIRAALAEDLPARLSAEDVVRPLSADGKPIGYVQVETTVRYESVELVGSESTSHWQESVRVGFSSASVQQTFGASTSVSATGGYAGEAVQDIDPTGTDIGPSVGGGRSASRAESLSGGGTTIHVGVHRFVGPTQGYRMVLDHKVTVVLNGETAKPVAGKTTILTRIRANDAYRHGLPVDRATLTGSTRNGRPVLRGDVQPDALVPGRKHELPSWATDDDGNLNAAGPWNVQGVTGGEPALRAIVDNLARRGFLPPLDANGNPDLTKLSTDPIERHAQLLNLEELRAQLATERLEAGYDIAARGGLVVTLTRPRTGQPTQTISLRIGIEQHAAKFAGVSTDEAVALLNIGSDTAGRSGSRTKAWPWRADPLAMSSTQGLDGKASLSYGRQALSRVLAWFTGGTVNQVTLLESTSPLAVFEVSHTLTVTENGTEIYRSTPNESARLLIDSDLLPYDGQPIGTRTTGPVPSRVLNRAALLALGVGDLTKLLPEAMNKLPAVRQQLAAFLNPRNLLAHPEWTRTPYRTTLLVPSLNGISRRIQVALTGRIQDPTLVAVTEAVSGDINFALGNHGSSSGHSTSGSLEASAGASERSQGGGFTASTGTNTSEARTSQTIWGVERLTVETGRHYVFTAGLHLELAVGNGAAAPTASSTVFQLAERDALRFYSQGELPLPLHQVADAVERYLHGNLPLDRRAATSLVRRYRADLADARAAGAPVPALAAEHTAQALAGKLQPSPRPSPYSAEERLERILTQNLQPRQIDLPDHYLVHLGATLIESLELDGVDLLAEVHAQLSNQLGVDLASDPVLRQSLFADLAGKRWWGRLEDMLGATGFVRTYPLGKPGELSADQVSLRVRAEFVDAAEDLGTADDVVSIGQRYLYTEQTHTQSSGRTTGLDVNGSIDAVHSGSVGSDWTEGTSTTEAGQLTRLERMATFDGTARVGRGLRLTVEVTHDSATPTRGPLGRRLTPNVTRITAPAKTLTGRMVQLIPKGMLGKSPSAAATPAGQFATQLPATYYVEGTGGRLVDVVRRILGRNDLLGPDGVVAHQAELESKLAASAHNAAFSRMASEEGFQLEPFEVTGAKQQTVEVDVRARVSEVELVSGPMQGGELGEVNRSQHNVTSSTTTGRLLPIDGSGTLSAPDVVSGTMSGGEQIGETTSDVWGSRSERSRFEKGDLVTVRVRVDYDLNFSRTSLAPSGATRVVTSHAVPNAATGEAYLTLHQHEYQALVDNLTPTPPAPAPAPPAAPTTSGWVPIHTGAAALAAQRRAQKAAVEMRKWKP